MRYGIELIPVGLFSDPREVVKVAQVADQAGWEAIWLWDHVRVPIRRHGSVGDFGRGRRHDATAQTGDGRLASSALPGRIY